MSNNITLKQGAILLALVTLLCSVFIWTNTKADKVDLKETRVKVEAKADKVELEKAEVRLNAKIATLQETIEEDVKSIQGDVKEMAGKQDQMLIYMLTGKIDEVFKRNLLGRREPR